MDRKQKTALKNKKYRDKKKEELENLKQENELLKQRLAACQAEMVELRDFKAFATSNHSNIAEEFLDIRTYGNRPEALGYQFMFR